jgi:hypothetical protein
LSSDPNGLPLDTYTEMPKISATGERVVRGLLFLVVIATTQVAAPAIAEERSLAIKSGETLELGQFYFISNCRSILKGPPTAEILDGPPQLSVSVKQAQVEARLQKCPKPVLGGILFLTAKEIMKISVNKTIVRIKYETNDGDRYRSEILNVTMVP